MKVQEAEDFTSIDDVIRDMGGIYLFIASTDSEGCSEDDLKKVIEKAYDIIELVERRIGG
jgi:hypothetical protein